MQHTELIEMQRQYAGALGGPRAVVTEGLLMLTGTYTAISPFVMGWAATQPALTANNVILGLVLAAIGLGLTGTPERGGGISWTAAPIGIWLIIAPFIIRAGVFNAGLLISNIVVGAVALVLGLVVAGLVVVSRGKPHKSAE
jgi:hypothetical protein